MEETIIKINDRVLMSSYWEQHPAGCRSWMKPTNAVELTELSANNMETLLKDGEVEISQSAEETGAFPLYKLYELR